MQTLAIKYRPATFDDVVEQGAIKLILQEQLQTNTHKNCYLFTGGAGTGKTTCARILAKQINNWQGNPIEIDAASNNGVDQVREIIGDAKFKALDAEYKVYIIDECHMLSNSAWNAMLKLIEEPPAKTLFIFCTTDPQKIPATILSRVQRFDFKRITHEGIVDRLTFVIEAEAEQDSEITAQREALEYIAKIADGGMRDAITLLDKCLSYNKAVTVENVVTALGVTDYDMLFKVTTLLINNHPEQLALEMEKMHRSGINWHQFIKQYITFILDAYKYYLTGTFYAVKIPATYEDKLEEWDDAGYDAIKALLQTIVDLNQQIKWETSPRFLVEATLLAFKPPTQ